LRPRDGGGSRRLLGALGALVAVCLVAAALGALVTGRWTPLHSFAPSAAAASADNGAQVPSPHAIATPDQALAAAEALLAAPAPPVRLQVPSIKVDAAVEPVGLDGQGRMGVPSLASDVAWYQLGAAPGDVGDAVIAGHLDWTSGPAVFWYLGRVKKGDPINVVRADGSSVKFIADASSMVPYDSSTDALFTKQGPPSLTLITCAGTWDRARGTYLQRLVIHASLATS
jgi:hypothetical protein